MTPLQELYQLAKIGSITWSIYKSYKKKPVAMQKAKVLRYSTTSKGYGKTKRRPTSTSVAKVAKQVKNIQHRLNNDMASHTHRNIDVLKILAEFGKQDLVHIEQNTSSRLEGAMALFRYYDPANPATLVTADASTGTYSRQITVKNASCATTFRNNFISPVNVIVYECSPRDDTSINPEQTVINGMIDQYITSPTINQPNTYPSDIDQFKEMWTIKKTVKKFLQAGQEFTHHYNSGKFTFDPSVYDTHGLNYQRQYKASVLLVKVFGSLCHASSTPTDIGLMKCAVDVWTIRTTHFEYDAGTSLNDFSIQDDSISSFISPTLSNKPVADGQQYATG